METMVTSIPMLILVAIACRGVLIVIYLKGILLWMKLATPPCGRRFICPSLNNPLYDCSSSYRNLSVLIA